MPPKITVAVVSYNTRELLRECLAACAGDDRLEVWVVDNASGDGSPEMVRKTFPSVRLEARTDNIGFGRAVNFVAERSEHWDWLAVANADTALTPGAIDALLAAGRADPGAGALAPRLIRPDGSTQHSPHPFWTTGLTLGFHLRRQHRDRRWGDEHCLEGFWDAGRPRRVPWAVGAFLLVRREAWLAAGGFDPGQWLYAEDLDLGWRLREAGWATRYVPDGRVLHKESSATGPEWGEARTERWMAATYDWMLRRRGPVRTRTVAAINVVADGLRMLASRPGNRAGYRRWMQLHAVGLRSQRAIRARLARPRS